jgi:hypothetical protein
MVQQTARRAIEGSIKYPTESDLELARQFVSNIICKGLPWAVSTLQDMEFSRDVQPFGFKEGDHPQRGCGTQRDLPVSSLR